MIALSELQKNTLRYDNFPFTDNISEKEIYIFVPGRDVITSESFATDRGDFELTESICNETKLKFGKCNAAQVKFTLANTNSVIKGQEIEISQATLGSDGIWFFINIGIFKITSCKKSNDRYFQDIVGYDRMINIDVDCTEYYNIIVSSGATLSQLREWILASCGIVEYTPKPTLPNDNMVVSTAPLTSKVTGRQILEAINELNGCFGKINRDGYFTCVVLRELFNDYPQIDYPKTDYPQEETYDEIVAENTYQDVEYEEIGVPSFGKIIIKKSDGTVGATYGTGNNIYTIEYNILLAGKTNDQLLAIAQNASINIFNRGYRPFVADLNGLPYVEAGDYIKFDNYDVSGGYVLSRTMTGIQSLRDQISANGS